MIIIQVLTFIFMFYGIYIIIASQLNLPKGKTVKVLVRMGNLDKEIGNIDMIRQKIALRIVPLIKIDEHKKKRLTAGLRTLDMQITPEMYKALIISKTFLILLCLIPIFMTIPLLSILIILLAVVTYFKGDSNIEKALEIKKTEIEYELPRFASNIKQELKATRDVLSILERYQKNAGNAMKKELEITIADMKSSDYTAALIRFEARISSAMLSDVIRGLIGVLRGDNNVTYFEMLSHDFDALELERLEGIAMKQPGKIMKYLFLLLVCFILMYGCVLIIYLIQASSGSGLF